MPLVRIDLPQSIGAEQRASIGEIVGGPGMEQGVWHIIGEDLGWLRSLTSLPLLLKGIQHPDDGRRARDYGVDGIYCSNHGGRQANGGLASLDALPAVVEAAG